MKATVHNCVYNKQGEMLATEQTYDYLCPCHRVSQALRGYNYIYI